MRIPHMLMALVVLAVVLAVVFWLDASHPVPAPTGAPGSAPAAAKPTGVPGTVTPSAAQQPVKRPLRPHEAGSRIVVPLVEGWSFQRSDIRWAEHPRYVETGWSTVTLPHTWNGQDGQDGGNNYYRGVGWYRKRITVPREHDGKECYLTLEGASLIADVYVNGIQAGRHVGGFAGFAVRLTDHLRVGEENLLAIKVSNAQSIDTPPFSGDFTVCGGLYRKAFLTIVDRVHVALDDFGSSGVYLTQRGLTDESASVVATVKVRNDGDAPEQVMAQVELLDATGKAVATQVVTATVPPHSTQPAVATLAIERPHRWDGVRDPYLYRARASIAAGGVAVDHVEQPVGLRTVRYDPENGFFLNERPYDLHGVGLHQGRQDRGWAVRDSEIDEDVAMIRELGATFVRLAHYQHHQRTYDLFDRAGILCWTEVPLTQVLGLAAFAANSEQQLRELIRQNYNHPSVLCWGLFNELGSKPEEVALVKRLIEVAREEDDTRVSVGATYQPDDAAAITHLTEVVSFNKYYGWYIPGLDQFGPWCDKFHRLFPQKPFGITEYGVSGNIAQHESKPSEPAFSIASIKLQPHTEEYHTYFHERAWKQLAARPYLWCKTMWVMFDFASDARTEGSMPGITGFGLVTADRKTKKDAFFWYQANWSSAPVLHITGRRFVKRPERVQEVTVYANADSVALRINGTQVPALTSTDRIFRWTGVVLQPGVNRVEAVGTWAGQERVDTVTWEAP